MSYAPMNYTGVSENLHGTPLLKKHKCKFCNYTSDQSNNVTRHALKKHSGMNNTNVQSYGLPMEIENAGVVYQQNYQAQASPSNPQLPLHGAATVNQFNIPPHQQPVYHQSVYQQTGYNQQPFFNGSVQPENAQPVYHQGAYLSDVGTQTSVQSDEEEADISELITDVNKNFMDILSIKEEYLAALPQLRELGDIEMKRFLKNYAEFKVRFVSQVSLLQLRSETKT